MRESAEIERNDVFRCILKCLISPIWFILECCAYHTHVSQFLLTNVAFFHFLPIVPNYAMLSIPFVYPKNNQDTRDAFWIMFFFYITVYLILPILLRAAIRNYKPRVQNMSHVILGLIGMILSTWMSIGAFIAIGFEFHINISTYTLILSMGFMFFFYFTFCSAKTNLYIRLPSEQLPFSGFKFHVIFIALFHLSVAIATTITLPKNVYICLLLVAFSFVICCDAWSCLFTKVYMLCEHREYKHQMKTIKPIDGIIYNVAVRKSYETKRKVLPVFDYYDDEIQVDDKWLQDNDIGCYWT